MTYPIVVEMETYVKAIEIAGIPYFGTYNSDGQIVAMSKITKSSE